MPWSRAINPMSPEQVEKVHGKALAILERSGFTTSSDRVLKLMAEAGCQVGVDAKRICMTPEFVEEKRRLAPASFTLGTRNPAYELLY